jgi:hypothetical protein
MKAVLAAAALTLGGGTAFAQDRPPPAMRAASPVVSESPNRPAGVNQTVTAPAGSTFQYSTDTRPSRRARHRTYPPASAARPTAAPRPMKAAAPAPAPAAARR